MGPTETAGNRQVSEILVGRPGSLSFPGSREESKRVSRLSLCLSCGGMPVCIPVLGALPEGLSQLSLLGPLPAPGTVSTLISFSGSFPLSFLSLLSPWFFSHVAHQSEKLPWLSPTNSVFLVQNLLWPPVPTETANGLRPPPHFPPLPVPLKSQALDSRPSSRPSLSRLRPGPDLPLSLLYPFS